MADVHGEEAEMTCNRCHQVPPPIATLAEDDFSFPRVIHGICFKCVVELARLYNTGKEAL